MCFTIRQFYKNTVNTPACAHAQASSIMVRGFFVRMLQSALSCCLDTRDTSYVIISETHV